MTSSVLRAVSSSPSNRYWLISRAIISRSSSERMTWVSVSYSPSTAVHTEDPPPQSPWGAGRVFVHAITEGPEALGRRLEGNRTQFRALIQEAGIKAE